MKVLYVSDSLGTPIRPRGIFNFSLSLVEILNAMGAVVDLIVEGGAGFGLEGRYGGLTGQAPDAVNTVRLAEIHRYFSYGKFGFRWNFRSRRYRVMLALSRPYLRLWISLRELFGFRRGFTVRNDVEQLDFVPQKSQHLTLFHALVVKRGFYAASMSRANLGMAPVPLDASGYDLAIVDTPHFVKIDGIARERILTIVHDLIPLRDPTMDADWRYLFIRKLEATMALGANLVFVSGHTQETFKRLFPHHAAPRRFVFYPALRRQLIDSAGAAQARLASWPVAPGFTSEVDAPWPEKRSGKGKRRAAPVRCERPAHWNEALPYFVTAASDEPRKNLATLVRAFAGKMVGTANVVILGELDPARYLSAPVANVFFASYVSDAEKIDYFRAAAGVVFASLSEGFGIPLIEGAVLGAPVVCSDIEVFREVAADDAVYFDPGDPASLARAVSSVIANPEAAQRRARALRRSVLSRFSQEAVGETVRAALAELGLRPSGADLGLGAAGGGNGPAHLTAGEEAVAAP